MADNPVQIHLASGAAPTKQVGHGENALPVCPASSLNNLIHILDEDDDMTSFILFVASKSGSSLTGREYHLSPNHW